MVQGTCSVVLEGSGLVSKVLWSGRLASSFVMWQRCGMVRGGEQVSGAQAGGNREAWEVVQVIIGACWSGRVVPSSRRRVSMNTFAHCRVAQPAGLYIVIVDC